MAQLLNAKRALLGVWKLQHSAAQGEVAGWSRVYLRVAFQLPSSPGAALCPPRPGGALDSAIAAAAAERASAAEFWRRVEQLESSSVATVSM
eukprot:6189258-Pleurochrysis_carterae.AAC.1